MPIGIYKRKVKRNRKAYDKKRNTVEYAALKKDATVYPLYLEQKRTAVAARRRKIKVEAMAEKLFNAYYDEAYSFSNATESAKTRFRKLALAALYS